VLYKFALSAEVTKVSQLRQHLIVFFLINTAKNFMVTQYQ